MANKTNHPRKPAMPQTRAEWQSAVDAAEACLTLDSARQYGLVEGGPVIDVRRCRRVLREGRQRGIRPSPGVAEQFWLEWNASVEEQKGEEGHEQKPALRLA